MSAVESTELLSSTDVADLLGVTKAAVSNWKVRDVGFPRPVATVGRGLVDLYLLSEIVAWYLDYRPNTLLAKHLRKP